VRKTELADEHARLNSLRVTAPYTDELARRGSSSANSTV